MKTKIAAAAAALLASVALAAPAQANEPFLVCPSGRSGVATQVTSCAFADNVRANYFYQGSGSVLAYSPVTGATYNMWCSPGYVSTLNSWPWQVSSVRCTGGNNAVVVFW
jgi:hypothetical protein